MLRHLCPLTFFDVPLGDALSFLSGSGALDSAGLPGLLHRLRNIIEGRNATLLVVDGLVTAAEAATRHADLRRFTLGLQVYAESRGCTVVLLARAGAEVDSLLHTMVDAMLTLRDESVAAETSRVAEARKFRGAAPPFARARGGRYYCGERFVAGPCSTARPGRDAGELVSSTLPRARYSSIGQVCMPPVNRLTTVPCASRS
jgi:hypothetical protein